MKKDKRDQLSEVISFRLDKGTLDRMDALAEQELRSRGNMVMVTLKRSTDAIVILQRHLEFLVEELHQESKRNPDSPQAEYCRGELHATKWVAALFLGERAKDGLLDAVRKKTGLPIPHIVPLASDGNRYGFDIDAG
jgi:hypothetical protein